MCENNDEQFEILEELEDDLASRAFLHHCSDCYREGVEATIERVRALTPRPDVSV
jgi:hypothetical protein